MVQTILCLFKEAYNISTLTEWVTRCYIVLSYMYIGQSQSAQQVHVIVINKWKGKINRKKKSIKGHQSWLLSVYVAQSYYECLYPQPYRIIWDFVWAKSYLYHRELKNNKIDNLRLDYKLRY